jgi:hypothetical protein
MDQSAEFGKLQEMTRNLRQEEEDAESKMETEMVNE